MRAFCGVTSLRARAESYTKQRRIFQPRDPARVDIDIAATEFTRHRIIEAIFDSGITDFFVVKFECHGAANVFPHAANCCGN